jgi:hypothetical protein
VRRAAVKKAVRRAVVRKKLASEIPPGSSDMPAT